MTFFNWNASLRLVIVWYEDDIKMKIASKNEEDLKKKFTLKNEENLKNEDDLKIMRGGGLSSQTMFPVPDTS